MSKATNKFSPDVREWAVRLVLDNEGQHGSRWQAVLPIAARSCAHRSASGEPSGDDGAGISAEVALKQRCTASSSWSRVCLPFAIGLGPMAPRWLTFDRQVAESQVRVAVLNGFTAFGIPVTKAIGCAAGGNDGSRPVAPVSGRRPPPARGAGRTRP